MFERLYRLIILLICVFASNSWGWAKDVLSVRFLDVGYADAILLQLPNGQNGMVDVGGIETADYLIEYLDKRGIKQLDFIILTHDHDNHAAGLMPLSEHMAIKQVYVNATHSHQPTFEKLLLLMQQKAVPVTVLKRGDRIDLPLSALDVLVLHPEKLTGSSNTDSLSVLLSYGQTSFWLTADIPPDVQEDIIRDFPQVVHAQVVQVPHHGGQLSKRFKNQLIDKDFILSTGNNPYEKPLMPEINALNGRLWRTDQRGEIVITSDGKIINVTTE